MPDEPLGAEAASSAQPSPAQPSPAPPRPAQPADQPDLTQLEAAAEHDPTGLGLARSVARSVSRTSSGARHRSTRRPSRTLQRVDPQVSGAHPDDRDPKLLGAALDHLVDAKGWSTEVSLHRVLGEWAGLVGAAVAEHSVPQSYSDTVLSVRADSTSWATQLRLMAPQLVAILNERLGDGTVSRVAVQGPDAPSWKKGPRSVRDGRGPRDTYG